MLIPLAIINHFKPTRGLPGLKQLHELYPARHRAQGFHSAARSAVFRVAEFFPARRSRAQVDLKTGLATVAEPCAEEAERWMIERMGEGSDGLAAVFPAMLNALIALRALGYSETHPIYAKAASGFCRAFRG